jgi:hypothetical protein
MLESESGAQRWRLGESYQKLGERDPFGPDGFDRIAASNSTASIRMKKGF